MIGVHLGGVPIVKTVFAELDYETSANAGAAGTFQVIKLTDEDDNDITDKVDQGYQYPSIRALERNLSNIFGVTVKVELV
jgi:type I restriction enzyme S subunit